MWRLILDNLQYRQAFALGVGGAALLLAVLIHVTLSALLAQGLLPPPDDAFSALYLYPMLALFTFLITGISAQAGDLMERRLRMHGTLPRTRIQIGLARVFTPVVFILLGLAVAQIMMAGISLVWGKEDFAAVFALSGFFLFILQIVNLNAELESQFSKSTSYRLAVIVVVSMSILLFTSGLLARRFVVSDSPMIAFVQSIPDLNYRTMAEALKLYGLAGIVTGLHFLLFMRRKSLL